MAQLRARYVASFPEKRSLLEAAWQAIPNHPGAKFDLRVLCHKLAGSAPMYEFDELGRAARVACDALDDEIVPTTLAQHIERLLALLQK